jgi:hypothetical protein
MERRALLRGLLAGIPATAAVVTGVAAKSSTFVRATSEHSIEACAQQIEALRKRVESSDIATKRALRTLTALTALSLGLDVSALL